MRPIGEHDIQVLRLDGNAGTGDATHHGADHGAFGVLRQNLADDRAGSCARSNLCGVTAIITDYFYKIRQLELKRDLLNRGMSADEIRVVLDAGSKESRKALRQDSCRA